MKTQFKPGSSGNPEGRPPTTEERVALLKERLTPRAEIIFNGYIRAIGRARVDVIVEVHALKVAELQAGCETLRLKMKDAEPSETLINSITRLESTAARAERALFKAVPPKAEVQISYAERLAKKLAKEKRRHEET
jgi:chlorite dismutase